MILILMGFSSNPGKKYYHKLLRTRIYLLHISFAVALSVFGIYRVLYYDIHEVGYFMPLISLLVFRFFDWVIVKVEERHIIVVMRGDITPSYYKWYLDGLLTWLSIIIPFLISFLILDILMDNATHIPSERKKGVLIEPRIDT